MSIGNSGIQPGGAGGTTPAPGGAQPQAPQNTVAQEDAEAFDTALNANDKAKDSDKATLTPEQELIEMMKKNSVKQFMTSSQEHTQEVKKNLEG